ncbi:hypothetical protein HHI36_016223 [Cryptolaemus montrouzieri]|uniref:Zinc finger CCCH-type with G patch domain-containing protein n=1 Tax=Cryptolaemus montrouzieri TaxID=559131 RepID=A0ABD2NIT9_9CUCU
MSVDYLKQLEQVNNAIKSCSEEEREELLSLKSSIEELLSLTGENEGHTTATQAGDLESNIDEEYALFMAEINHGPSTNQSDTNSIESADLAKLKTLEGKKCKAPHVSKWGSKGYHNALICSILEPTESVNEIQAKVLFTNPTHEEMLPCPYYFDTDCKFSEDKCKYSHGEIVLLSDLQEYSEPDFESLKIGSEILAKQNNKLWGRARITRIFDNTCVVKFEFVKKDMELPFDEILPLDGEQDGEDDLGRISSDEDALVKQDIINMSLMNTPLDGPIGDWEKFTKGIGSKLMSKMGYIVGTGLGKKSDGRIDPVTAVILPAGKSLDHCMHLREKFGGDKDFFNAEKKMKRKQKQQELRNQKIYENEKKKKDVFKFLNDTLTGSGCSAPSFSKSQHRDNIKKETSRNLNVAGLKTDEDIRKTERICVL